MGGFFNKSFHPNTNQFLTGFKFLKLSPQYKTHTQKWSVWIHKLPYSTKQNPHPQTQGIFLKISSLYKPQGIAHTPQRFLFESYCKKHGTGNNLFSKKFLKWKIISVFVGSAPKTVAFHNFLLCLVHGSYKFLCVVWIFPLCCRDWLFPSIQGSFFSNEISHRRADTHRKSLKKSGGPTYTHTSELLRFSKNKTIFCLSGISPYYTWIFRKRNSCPVIAVLKTFYSKL